MYGIQALGIQHTAFKVETTSAQNLRKNTLNVWTNWLTDLRVVVPVTSLPRSARQRTRLRPRLHKYKMATNLVNCTQYQTKKLNPTNDILLTFWPPSSGSSLSPLFCFIPVTFIFSPCENLLSRLLTDMMSVSHNRTREQGRLSLKEN